MNPALLRFDNPAAFGATKMGVAGVSEVFVYQLAETRRGLAIGINISVGATFTGIGIRNTRVARPRP